MKRIFVVMLAFALCMLPMAALADGYTGYTATMAEAPDELTYYRAYQWHDGWYLVLNGHEAPYLLNIATDEQIWFTHLPEEEAAWLALPSDYPESFAEFTETDGVVSAWFRTTKSGAAVMAHQARDGYMLIELGACALLLDMNAHTIHLTNDACVLLEDGQYIGSTDLRKDYNVYSANGDVIRTVSTPDIAQEGGSIIDMDAAGDTEAFLVSQYNSSIGETSRMFAYIREGGSAVSTIPLGQCELGRTPRFIEVSADGGSVIVWNSSNISETPLLVRKGEDTASVLCWDGAAMNAIPLDAESFPYDIAAENSVCAHGLQFSGMSADGRYAALVDVEGGLLMMDVATLQTDVLLSAEELEGDFYSPASALYMLDWDGSEHSICARYLLRLQNTAEAADAPVSIGSKLSEIKAAAPEQTAAAQYTNALPDILAFADGMLTDDNYTDYGYCISHTYRGSEEAVGEVVGAYRQLLQEKYGMNEIFTFANHISATDIRCCTAYSSLDNYPDIEMFAMGDQNFTLNACQVFLSYSLTADNPDNFVTLTYSAGFDYKDAGDRIAR